MSVRNTNQKIADSLIKTSARANRLTSSLTKTVDDLIVDCHRQLAALVSTRNPTTIKQADSLEAGSKLIIRRFYKQIADLMEDAMFDYSDVEQMEIQRALTKHIRAAFNG